MTAWVLAMWATTALAEEPTCGALTLPAADVEPTQLLGDRLRIPLPPGSTTAELPHGSGPPVPASEGGLWFVHAGEDRLGVLVQRVHALATARFPDEVAEALDPAVQREPFTAGPLSGIALWTTVAPTGTGVDVPVLDALLRLDDGEVVQVSLLTDDDTAVHGASCVAYARALVASARPGEARIDRAARAERVALTDAAHLELRVPDDTVVVSRPGPDYRVFDVEVLRPLTDTSLRATLYVGTSPTPIPEGSTRWQGRLARGRVTWVEVPGEVEGTHRLEAQRVVSGRTLLHVTVEGLSTETAPLVTALARARLTAPRD